MMELSTTWLEALLLKKPVIMKVDFAEVEPEALPDVLQLQEVGIVVDTWEKLAEQVNEVADGAFDWWNDDKRQSVVKRMMNKYMYLPENSLEIWEKHLKIY
jgi:putative transferase (TIGR04331 family)